MDRLVIGAHYLAYAMITGAIFCTITIVLRREYQNILCRSFQIVLRYIYITYLTTVGFVVGIFDIHVWRLQSGISFNFNLFANESVELILLNFLLFIPFGGLSPFFFLHLKKTRNMFVCSFVLCVVIEITQGLFLGRLMDIDDIVANTTGCLVGYFAYLFIRWTRRKYFPFTDVNNFAPIILDMLILIGGINHHRISIFDIVFTSLHLPIWSGNKSTVISLDGLHYTNIAAMLFLLIPLGMAISIYRTKRLRIGLVVTFITLSYFIILTIIQYL